MKIDLAERCAAGWVRAPPHVRRGTTTQCTSQCARAFSTNTHVISPCARPTHHTRAHHPKRHPRAIRHLHRLLASSSQHCFLVLLSQRHPPPRRRHSTSRLHSTARTHTVRASYPPGHGPRPSPNRIAASTRRRPSPPWRTPRTHSKDAPDDDTQPPAPSSPHRGGPVSARRPNRHERLPPRSTLPEADAAAAAARLSATPTPATPTPVPTPAARRQRHTRRRRSSTSCNTMPANRSPQQHATSAVRHTPPPTTTSPTPPTHTTNTNTKK